MFAIGLLLCAIAQLFEKHLSEKASAWISVVGCCMIFGSIFVLAWRHLP